MILDVDLFKIDLTYDPDLVRSIVTIPKLYELAIGDGTPRENWYPQQGSVWLLGTYDNEPVGVLNLEAKNHVMIEYHWYTKPQYWGSPMLDLMEYEAIEWLRKNTHFLKLMVTCPSLCPHTIQAATSHDMVAEGYFKNAMVWKGQLCDMVVLTKQIKTLEEMNEQIMKKEEITNG